MTATYDTSTNVGKVRLLIGDTDVIPASDAHFTDEELEVFLSMASDSVYLAAAMALESWASTLTENAESEKIGDYAYTKKSAANKLALAQRYRDSDLSVPVMEIASMNLTSGSAITEEED